MQKKIISSAFISVILIAAFFSWNSVNRAIFIEGAGDFWTPLLWFSFFASATCLLMVLVKEKAFVYITLGVAIFSSFVFVHSFFHLVIAIIAWSLLFAAKKNINEDIETSVKIRLLKSLPRGMFPIAMAFALMISSQYYFSVRNLEPSKIAPNINKSEGTSGIINLILPRISPEFQQVKSDEISIDEFLGEIYESIIRKEEEEVRTSLKSDANSAQNGQVERIIESELGRKLTDDEKKQLEAFEGAPSLETVGVSPETKQIVVDGWKKELSKSVGFEVRGDEKVADIFVAIVNNKIDTLVQLENGKEKSRILPLIFSILLFATLISLGSLVSKLWTVFAATTFWILRKARFVKIEKKMVEAEVIS